MFFWSGQSTEAMLKHELPRQGLSVTVSKAIASLVHCQVSLDPVLTLVPARKQLDVVIFGGEPTAKRGLKLNGFSAGCGMLCLLFWRQLHLLSERCERSSNMAS